MNDDRRIFVNAQRRRMLDLASETIRLACAHPRPCESTLTTVRAAFADTPDAPIVERMIASALGARVANPKES